MEIRELALDWAKLGIKVFPLRQQHKKPLEGTHGVKDATTDEEQIKEWFPIGSKLNYGIATGKLDTSKLGLLVIDIDLDEKKGKNGFKTLKEWEDINEKLPNTYKVVTGRGGEHLLYLYNTEKHSIKNSANLLNGLDVRAEGGYIVGIGSIHENGNKYSLKADSSFNIAYANDTVFKLLNARNDITTAANENISNKSFLEPFNEKEPFILPTKIVLGSRNDMLFKYGCSLRAKGVKATQISNMLVKANNEICESPLSNQEIAIIYNQVMGYKEGTKIEQNINFNTTKISEIEKKAPEWLVNGYMPSKAITLLCGEGGSGKTSVWCEIAAAVSSGNFSILEQEIKKTFGSNEVRKKGRKVLAFSSEDTFEYTLRAKLEKHGANLDNIATIDQKDERFTSVKFGYDFLKSLLEYHKPTLCIFDPIQAFIPPSINMASRNEMRESLAHLNKYAVAYGTTFLIVVHTNKQAGVWGRKRIADSSDLWDIARSVLILGETNEKSLRYLAQEKNNLAPQEKTVLYTLDDGKVNFKGFTDKKDIDFIQEERTRRVEQPKRDEAKEFILTTLEEYEGKMEVSELDGLARAMSISPKTLRNAKEGLKKENLIKTFNEGFSPKKWYIELIDPNSNNDEPIL